MSIVRVGLGETENFADGYEAIFGKKKEEPAEVEEKPSRAEPPRNEEDKEAKC